MTQRQIETLKSVLLDLISYWVLKYFDMGTQGSCDKRGARKVHSASICCELKSWNCLLALLRGTVLRDFPVSVRSGPLGSS